MKLPVWSYTLFRNYENCPKKAYHLNVAKDLPKSPQSAAQTWGNAVHDAMAKRVERGTPLPADMQQFEPLALALDGKGALCELKLGIRKNGTACGFFDNDVWGRGTVDINIMSAPVAFILDWKTGKKGREEVPELELHALLIQAHYPRISKITGAFAWMQDQTIGKPHDLSHTPRTFAIVNQVMDTLAQDIEKNHFPPRPNPLCGWCPVTFCPHNKAGK